MKKWHKLEEHEIRGEANPPERLLWSPKFGITIGFVHRYRDGDVFTTANGFHGVEFTRWMPLPDDPSDEQ